MDFTFEVKSLTEAGEFEGLASTYGNVDAGNDVIERGAFTESLKQRSEVPILWTHDMSNPVGLGTLIDTPQGLKIEGKLDLDTQAGRDAYSRLKKRIVRGLSIGYRAMRDFMKDGVRHLTQVDVREVSLVPFPMNEHAMVTNVKGQVNTVRDFEKFLHGAGWSKSEAAKLAGHGFKGLALPDPDPIEDELRAWLAEQKK